MQTKIYESAGRRYHLPYHAKLERLLRSFDPEIGPFELSMERRHARDLRIWLFGPTGSRVVPKRRYLEDYDGRMEFDLPNGWLLRFDYAPPAPAYVIRASEVDAEFIPPTMREEPPIPPQWPENLAA